MQADTEAETPDGLDSTEQRWLQSRLAAGENNSIEQAAATLKKRDDVVPRNLRIALCRPQIGIVAIAAIPCAALAKYGGNQFSGPVAGGQVR